MKFNIGETVVYPAHGVGIIENIETRTIAGKEEKFYIIKIIDNVMTIMVPVSTKNGLRRVINSQEVEEVKKVLSQKVTLKLEKQAWTRRHKEYVEKLKSGSIIDVACIMRDLSQLKEDKVLSFTEKKILNTAKNLLVGEISIAKNMDKEEVEKELSSIIAH